MSKRRSLSLAIVLLLLLAAFTLGACSRQSPTESTPVEPQAGEGATDQPPAEEPTEQPLVPDKSPGKTKDVTDLKIEDKVVGTGAEAKPGSTVDVHYTGWLTDGSKFDSSRDSGKPFRFTIGQGQVIQGWDEGIAGMKVGGKRRLFVPPTLGYGPQGYPPVIPPNATLVFDVELLSVE